MFIVVQTTIERCTHHCDRCLIISLKLDGDLLIDNKLYSYSNIPAVRYHVVNPVPYTP